MSDLRQRYSGRPKWVAWENSAGVQHLVSEQSRNFEVALTGETIDASAGSAQERWHIPGHVDGNATMTILDEGGTSLTHFGLARGQEGTLYWGPKGSASGYPLHEIEAILTDMSLSYPYDGVVEISLGWQIRGTFLKGLDGTFA